MFFAITSPTLIIELERVNGTVGLSLKTINPLTRVDQSHTWQLDRPAVENLRQAASSALSGNRFQFSFDNGATGFSLNFVRREDILVDTYFDSDEEYFFVEDARFEVDRWEELIAFLRRLLDQMAQPQPPDDLEQYIGPDPFELM